MSIETTSKTSRTKQGGIIIPLGFSFPTGFEFFTPNIVLRNQLGVHDRPAGTKSNPMCIIPCSERYCGPKECC